MRFWLITGDESSAALPLMCSFRAPPDLQTLLFRACLMHTLGSKHGKADDCLPVAIRSA